MPLCATLIASLLCTTGAFFLWLGDEEIVKEDHLIENTQVALLLLAFAVHGGRAVLRPSPLDRLVRIGLALLCLSMLLRELDIHRLVSPAAELTLRGMVVVGWVAYVAVVVPRLDALWQGRWRLIFSWCGIFTAAAMGLYAFSLPFDKMLIPLPEYTAKFIEQGVLQLNATIFFFTAAALTPRLSPETPTD